MMGCPTIVTVFPVVSATSAKESQFEEIPALVRGAVGPLKNWLPMLKLARFGSAPNANGCLRYDANVVTITGIEADYDGEKLCFAEAVSLISCAWIEALVYTSPSHTDEAPRWRVLCPTSRELDPALRAELVSRLDGVLGGVLSRESWTLSQAYFYGRLLGGPEPRIERARGRAIDLCDELPITRRLQEPPQLDTPRAAQVRVKDKAAGAWREEVPRLQEKLRPYQFKLVAYGSREERYAWTCLQQAFHKLAAAKSGGSLGLKTRHPHSAGWSCGAGLAWSRFSML